MAFLQRRRESDPDPEEFLKRAPQSKVAQFRLASGLETEREITAAYNPAERGQSLRGLIKN
jgi:hypothetical protein